MKASHYVSQVKKSAVFKDFMKEAPDAYLCSLFCIRDFNGPQNETQVDFYSPKSKHIISFKIGSKGIERLPQPKKAETITHKKIIPKELKDNVKLDLDKLKPTLVDEMRNRDMTYEIEKMLIVLNVPEDRPIWNCTAFLKGLGLLQAHVEDASNSVLFMEKKSLMDMMKFAGGAGGLPGLPGMPAAGEPNPLAAGGGSVKIMSPQELAAALQKAKAAAKEAEKADKADKKKARTK